MPIAFGPDCKTFYKRVDIKMSFKTEPKKQHQIEITQAKGSDNTMVEVITGPS